MSTSTYAVENSETLAVSAKKDWRPTEKIGEKEAAISPERGALSRETPSPPHQPGRDAQANVDHRPAASHAVVWLPALALVDGRFELVRAVSNNLSFN